MFGIGRYLRKNQRWEPRRPTLGVIARYLRKNSVGGNGARHWSVARDIIIEPALGAKAPATGLSVNFLTVYYINAGSVNGAKGAIPPGACDGVADACRIHFVSLKVYYIARDRPRDVP